MEIRRFFCCALLAAQLACGRSAGAQAAGGAIATRLESGLPAYSLVPEGWNIDHIRRAIGEAAPTETIEASFFIAWPAKAPRDEKGREELVRYALRRVSGMKGLTYPPSSKKAGTVLYKEAYVVASPNDLRPLPDPRPEDLKDGMILYTRTLNDEGNETVMRIVSSKAERIRLRFDNQTPMRFLLVTVVAVGGLSFALDLAVEAGGLRVYAVGAIKTFRAGIIRPALRQRLSDATEAIAMWIAHCLEKEAEEWN